MLDFIRGGVAISSGLPKVFQHPKRGALALVGEGARLDQIHEAVGRSLS